MDLQVFAENLPAVLTGFPGISLVYLFGSQVTGQTGPMSDYDFAIVDFSARDSLEVQTGFQYALMTLLRTDGWMSSI